MVDVVGLRFVTTGEKEALQALDAYRRGQKSLADLQDKHVAAFNRVIRAQEQAKRAYDQLAGSLDPNVAAANRLASAQKTLQTAFEQGIISAQKKAAMLRQLNAQYRADELNRYAAAQRKVSDTIIQGDAVVKRLSGDMQLLTERLKQGTVTQQQHDTALKALARQLAINNNYVKANGALNTQKAMAELRAMEATRAAAAADAAAAATKARLTQSYNQLLASINPVIARQQQTRQTVDMLRAAVAAGAITTTQAAQALNQYRNSLHALNAANQLATRGMNRVGVITQQAGYQVGDFIVQIQSGTNVMVALGQQATQLIGTFAMLARTTRGIAIFSALGVAVPILTAVGAAIMRASGASDTLEQKLQKLDQSADKLGTTLDRLEDTELDQKFGNLADEVFEISEAMLALDQSAQLNNLMGVLDRVEDAASAGWFRMMDAQMAQGVQNIRAFFNPFESMVGPEEVTALENEKAFSKLGFDMARSQFLSYTEELQRLAQAGDLEGVTAAFNRFIQDATDNGAELSMTGIALAASMERSALATAEIAARLNGSAQAAKDAADAEKRRQEALRAGADAFAAHVAAYREEQIAAAEAVADQQAALLEENTRFEAEQEKKRAIARAEGDAARIAAINLYYDNAEKREAELARVEAERAAIRKGESDFLRDSEAETELARRQLEILQSYNAEGEATTRTQELRIALDMDILRGKLLQQAAADGITDAEREAIAAQVEMEEKLARTQVGIENATAAAKGLTAELRAAASAMASLAGMGASVDVRIAGLEAEINAYAQGLNAQAERRRATELEKARQERDQALLAPGVDVAGVDAVFQGVVQRLDKEAALTTERDAIVEAQREADRAAKRGGTATQDDYLKNLLLEAEQKRRLVGLSEEETRRQEILFELKKRELPLNDERIEQIIKAEAETRKLIEAERQREQLMQTIEGNIKSAFMSMVDGSQSVEDAFRNMLRNIILAIYEQKVATPAATAIGGLFNTAIGSLFGPGMTTGTPLTIPSSGVDSLLPSFDGGGFTGYGPRGGGMDGKGGFLAMLHPRETVVDHANGQATGSVTVNQYFSIAANGDDSVRRIVRQEAPRMAEMAKAAVVDAKRRGGSYGRSF